MNSLKRTSCLLLALALALPSLAYPARADEATTTPVSDGTALAPDAAPGAGTPDPSVEGGALVASDGSSADASTTSQETQDIDDSSSSSASSATSTESDSALSLEASGAQGSVASSTESDATSTGTVAEGTTTPPLPDAPLLPADLGISTTTELSPGSATGTAARLATSTGPSIATGDAAAGANVINVAESNFVDSTGAIVLANYFGSTTGIDLRDATSSFSTGAFCLLFSCTGGEGVSLNLSATSSLSNLLVLNATTGGNQITGTGTASITTGDALTGLNLVNIANLNVVDSNYFMALLNAFHGLSGDLVFPSLYGWSRGGAAGSVLSLDSNAAIDNQLALDAGTGGNMTDATTSALSTGSALTYGTLMNELDSDLAGGANLAILLRVSGAWNGQVFSAPAGISIVRGGDGSILLLASSAEGGSLSDAALSATSSASIRNAIQLGAFTGDNAIFGADSALIQTGDARIGANILDLANQNIIGRNWLTAIVNVFGDFNGNIAFGRPDLWVGERVEAPARIVDGSPLVFHFTVTNKGDAPATGAALDAALDDAHLSITDGTTTAQLGTLDPGQSAEVVVRATVHAAAGTAIDTSGTASERETDNNDADNTDRLVFSVLGGGGGGGGGGGMYRARAGTAAPTAAGALQVARATVSAVTGPGRTVHEELSLSNPTDATSTPVDLHDLLKNSAGTVIHDEAWPVGALAPHEEVKVTYDIAFGADTPLGRYGLSTVIASDAGDTEFRDNGSIVVLGAPAVLGAHAEASATVATSSIARTVPPAGPAPLAAAAAASGAPWQYALGFALSAALLAGFLWAAAVLRRRFRS